VLPANHAVTIEATLSRFDAGLLEPAKPC